MPTENFPQLLYKKQLPLTMGGMYPLWPEILAEKGLIHYIIDGSRIINN